jgi:hypothetical protein
MLRWWVVMEINNFMSEDDSGPQRSYPVRVYMCAGMHRKLEAWMVDGKRCNQDVALYDKTEYHTGS